MALDSPTYNLLDMPPIKTGWMPRARHPSIMEVRSSERPSLEHSIPLDYLLLVWISEHLMRYTYSHLTSWL
jgi:hypothetical protein